MTTAELKQRKLYLKFGRSTVQYVVLKVCIKKIKIVLAKMEKVLYTIPVSAVDIPR